MPDLPATVATASPATYDREKLRLIRDMFAKGANDNEFGVMVELARKYQLDPFGGSGTVAKVARDLGRSSILIELNPEYVRIAKKRLRIGEQLDSGVCEYVVEEVTV